jgi:hypothetical protein
MRGFAWKSKYNLTRITRSDLRIASTTQEVLVCGIYSFKPESGGKFVELLVDAAGISSVLLTSSRVLKHFQAFEADT